MSNSHISLKFDHNTVMKIYENKKNKIKRKPLQHPSPSVPKEYSAFDPFGSYTGVCKDKFEVPVQDAGDL